MPELIYTFLESVVGTWAVWGPCVSGLCNNPSPPFAHHTIADSVRDSLACSKRAVLRQRRSSLLMWLHPLLLSFSHSSREQWMVLVRWQLGDSGLCVRTTPDAAWFYKQLTEKQEAMIRALQFRLLHPEKRRLSVIIV